MLETYFGRMVLQVLASLGVITGIQLTVYWLVNKYTRCNLPLSLRIILSIAGTVVIYGLTLAVIGG